MPTIIKAKNQVSYFIAIVVSALFSFFGKGGPAWATDITREKDAKVFNELYRVAAAPTINSNITTAPNTRGVTPRDVGANRTIIDLNSPEINDELVRVQVEAINAKLQSNQQLTLDEFTLIKSLENEKRLNDIADQLKLLINLMQAPRQ